VASIRVQDQQYPVHIDRGPLDSALKGLAVQTGLQIARFSNVGGETKIVGPVTGIYTPLGALRLLLANTGLTFSVINPRTVAIVPAEDSSSVIGRSPSVAVPPAAQASPPPAASPAPTPEVPAGKATDAHRGFFARLAGIFAICGAAAAGTVCAQEAPDTSSADSGNQLQEVIVTGTSIRGVAPTGSELVTVSRTDIDATAASTSTELLRSLPQLNNFNATLVNTGSNQANFVDQPAIHGIGVGNGGAGLTLVLFDGHRLPGAGVNQTAPDAGVIPTSAIERVEVMADGGSSIYGSDAVAGVINFVPRKRFNGAETNARSGWADGYHTDNFSQLLGKSWDSGSVLFDYEYTANSALNGARRSYIVNDQSALGGPDSRSTVCTPANITAGGASFALSADGTITPGGTHRCESNSANDIYPRQWRNQFYLALRQELGEAIELYANTLYSGRSIRDKVAGAGMTSGNLSVTVPSTSPYYIGLPGVAPGTAETVTYDPSSDFGPFTNRIDTTTSSSVVGANVQLPRGWNARLELNYGVEHDTVNEYGINQALAISSAAAGTFNPYGVGPATNPSLLRAIGNFDTNYSVRQLLKDQQLKLDGPLFEMPGGPVKAAVGFDARQEEFDGATVAAPVGSGTVPYVSDGKRNSASAFVELYLPLVSGRNRFAGMESLSLSLAARYDHYSDVGGTTNPKVGLEWTLIDGVQVRGSAGRSFHAPSLADAPSAIDTRAIRFACIAGVFVGCDGAAPDAYTAILAGGNKLQPETARTYNLGVDLLPSRFAGFKASATLFRVDYKDVITFPTFAPVTNPASAYDRYRTLRPAGITDAQWFAIIQPLLAGFRHDGLLYPDVPTLPTAVYDLRRQNFANELINGVDYNFGYQLDTGYGSLSTAIAGTQFMTFYQQIPGVPQVVQLIDTDYAVRTKVRGQLGWSYRDYAASVFLNYTGEYRNQSVTPYQYVASFVTTDVHLAWTVSDQPGLLDNLQLTVDANNLFDKRPPVYFTSGANGVVGFDPAVASPIGRLVSVGLHKLW
jgi:iron complex outermembrane receptor protein